MSQTAQILARHAKEEDALFKKALVVLKKEPQSGQAD
jgi:hypothetical protein